MSCKEFAELCESGSLILHELAKQAKLAGGANNMEFYSKAVSETMKPLIKILAAINEASD